MKNPRRQTQFLCSIRSSRSLSPRLCGLGVSAFLLLGIVSGGVWADTIYLNNGRKIEADILKDTPDKVVVDLGFEVLAIPRDQIQKIEKSELASSDRTSQTRVTDDLFCVGDYPMASVADLSPKIEEAVVMVKTPKGLGSGFIIHQDGYLITNFHVIEGETKITLNLFRREGSAYRNEKIENTRIIAVNPFLDLAMLKFDPPAGMKVTVVCLDADERDVAEGETAFAIGNPLGQERSVSQGIISKTSRRHIDGLLYIQTTTEVNPGNSGGPLFNTRGEVIGVTNMSYRFADGMHYAIPVRYVIDFLKHRDAYAYNLDNPDSGYQYIQPSLRLEKSNPDFLGTANQTKPEGSK